MMPNWTNEQLREYQARRNSGGKSSSAVLEPSALPALAPRSTSEKPHPGKRIVRITCYRVRKQDPDNGVYKFHVDAIRAAGLIPDDTEDDIELQTAQVKVSTRRDEHTEITVTLHSHNADYV